MFKKLIIKLETGASLVEYGLLVALVAVVCIGAVTFFGSAVSETVTTGASAVNN